MKWFILIFCMYVGHCEAFGNLGNLASSFNPLDMMFTNKCIEDLGCFYTGSPFFSPLVRPISVAPVDSPRPKFMLYTKANPSNAYMLQATPSSLQNSGFDPSAKTMFFIHGFKFKITPEDTQFKTKNELMKRGGYNVIIVDWTDYNGMPYEQAVANTRVIGAVIAKLIKFLMKQKGVSAQSFHLVGHSLGAHIAGYAGERIPNLGRITALDPAGPFFSGTVPEVRLDPTDATFVDVIHTNAANSMLSGLGTFDAIGHMDFFPNGGSKQPGCENPTGDEAPPKNDPTAIFGKHKCHHMRAQRLFWASVDPSCKFESRQCSSYAEYQSGKCRNSVASPMGMHAKKMPAVRAPAKFFVTTSGNPPYCLG